VLRADTPLALYRGQWQILSGYGVFSPSDTALVVTIDSLSYGDNVIGWRVYGGTPACDVETYITVRAFEPVNANAGVYLPICDGDEPIRLHADSTYIGVGQWSKVPNTSPVIFDNVYDPNTFASNFGWGNNTLRWTVVNGPCRDSATVIITKLIPEVCDSTCLEMPTAFSPNGDLVNDMFVIHCIEYSFNRENNFKVFNRWGNLVFEKDNYQNDPDKGWFGQNNTGDENSGKPLPDGTYFVILSINKSTRYPEGRVLHGYVDLRR
jgi:gliding motility-associated-like protein